MTAQRFLLTSELARRRAAYALDSAPEGAVCVIRPKTRSLQQNAHLWALLDDIARQVDWPVNGVAQKLSPDDWKAIFTASLREENRLAQGLRGGSVLLGASTRKMTVAEMGELITLMQAFGAERGVRFSAPGEVPGWIRDGEAA